MQNSVKNTGNEVGHGRANRLRRAGNVLIDGIVIIRVVLIEPANLIDDILEAIILGPGGQPFHPGINMNIEGLGQDNQFLDQSRNSRCEN